MAELDEAVIHFISHVLQHEVDGAGERVRGLYDFSGVAAFAVPTSKLDERSLRPPIVRRQRVMVAPPSASESFASSFRVNQRLVADSEPYVVRNLQEAYRLLQIEDPHFEPVAVL